MTLRETLVLILLLTLQLGLNKAIYANEEFSFPSYENTFLNDYANLLDGDVEQRIYQYLVEVRERDGIELTVLTLRSLQAYNAGPAIEPFATALFNHWGVGNAKRNDGVLILVARQDRKMRIELGSGYTASWDRRMKRVIDDVFVPRFKDGEYQTGLLQGVEETIFTLTGRYPEAVGNSMFAKAKRTIIGWVERLGAWLLVIVIPGVMYAGSVLRKLWRLRPRKCAVCRTAMHRLGEQVDDEHLEGPQRLEEYLESVDYDVWQCSACARIDLYHYKNWFSDYQTCNECGYRTLEADTTILRRATTSSTGLKRIDYHCKNCRFEDYEMRTLPRIPKSSSSSSGGSSGGFGGGSSSGGGASGSW